MTLTATTVRVQYSGDGSTTAFAVTFVFWDDDDFQAILTDSAGADTTWVRGTDYTVAGGSGATGTLTATTAPASGETLTIISNLTDTQDTDLIEGGQFPAASVEQQLDQIVRQIQQTAEELGRAIKLAVTSTFSGLTVPDPSADKVLGWNAGATDLENKTPNTDTLITLPGTSTDNAIPRFDGTGGASLQDSGVTISDTDVFAHAAQTRWVKGADIASASPLVLGSDGNYFDVTGTTGFSQITVSAGTFFILQFDGILTLTHGANLNLPGAADITTAAGDEIVCFATAANTTRVISYSRSPGQGTWRKGADLASADPLVLGTDGNYFDVTGTTNFASITVVVGSLFMLQFDGVLTLTHNATTLDLPGEANITTAAGDSLIGFATAADQVHVISYTKADGTAVVTSGGGLTSIANTSITAVTNIDFTGFDSTLYDNYEVWISNGQPGNDGVIPEMETSTDGGSTFDTGASDYSWLVQDAGAAISNDRDDLDSEIQLSGGQTVGNAANENISFKISVFGPEATEYTMFTWMGFLRDTGTVHARIVGGGDRISAADVNGLRFHLSAGDWVVQGNIQFLGIAQ